jgi:hypothetical protein
MPHYTNAEQLVTLLTGDSDGSNNYVNIGGGSSVGNAATVVRVYTAANDITLTGTERMRVASNGRVGVAVTVPVAQVHIDQASSTGAIPVMKLDQGDTSEQCIQFSSDGVDRDINLWTIDVTGSPTLNWDESSDRLEFNKTLFLARGGTDGLTCLYLDQNDEDQEFYTLAGRSAATTANNLTTLVGTGSVDGPGSDDWTFVGLYRINIQDAGVGIADGDYWVPFYTPA